MPLLNAIPGHVVKASPLHLLNFYPSVQLGYEANVYRHFSVFAEGGVVVGLHDQNERFLNKRGMKLKLEPRYYYSISRNGRILWYGATEFYFNQVKFDRRTIQRECFDRDCQFPFERQYILPGRYREFGFGLKGGMTIVFNRVLLDLNTGFGLRNIDYTLPQTSTLIDDIDGWGAIPNEKDRIAVTPLLGIRIGYRLDKPRIAAD